MTLLSSFACYSSVPVRVSPCPSVSSLLSLVSLLSLSFLGAA